jgi:hypothetical protein
MQGRPGKRTKATGYACTGQDDRLKVSHVARPSSPGTRDEKIRSDMLSLVSQRPSPSPVPFDQPQEKRDEHTPHRQLKRLDFARICAQDKRQNKTILVRDQECGTVLFTAEA